LRRLLSGAARIKTAVGLDSQRRFLFLPPRVGRYRSNLYRNFKRDHHHRLATGGAGEPQLVSVDHFRYELITQLRSAAVQGGTTIVVNSTELCRSMRNANHSTQACCEAMQVEIKPGE
jgi:hypothetical protein